MSYMYRKGDYLKGLYQKLKREKKREKIEKLVSKNINEEIKYAPSYQRNYIWSDTKAIKLIETILINEEVPPITIVVTNDIYEIIDGRQRYETLLRFCNDEIPLRAAALKDLKDLDGCVYSTLPPNVRTIFNEYPIKLITYTLENGTLITKEDLERVKRDLFRRHNYGMTALNKSEIARGKYLYDELTTQFRNHFLSKEEDYKKCISLFLPVSKRDNPERERLNLLLMNTRELLTMPYIPIIGLKTVVCSSAVIEQYYETFVIKESLTDKKIELLKIATLIENIKDKLKENNNPLQDNIIFTKTLYWMLSILYKTYPDAFYNFKINQFIHYLEEQDNPLQYFSNYKSLSSDNIINRHNYLKNYISKCLKLDVDKHLESILENRKKVIFKPTKKLNKEENWKEIGNRKQLITIDDTFSVTDIIKYIYEGRLIIRSVYQRGEVKSIEKASKIIESIILGIKLPPIYIMAKRNENSINTFTVIDGQQRLISILRFLGEEITDENYNYLKTYKKNYALKGLKELNYLNGKTYNGENQLNEQYKEIIKNYEIDVIRIDEQANPDFNPVDMFLRLNENPCTIGKNTFEMWNSFDIINVIETIKNIATYKLFKQNGNKMKEEELVTVLAYMAKKKINIDNCFTFFKILLHTENKDKPNERVEVKLSISNKNEITTYLENMQPGSPDEQNFLECLDQVKSFIEKLEILSDNEPEKLLKIFNPYLTVARKGSMKDFYIMWLILQNLDNHIIKTYKANIMEELEIAFKLMKKMPKNMDATFFINHIQIIIEKYQNLLTRV